MNNPYIPQKRLQTQEKTPRKQNDYICNMVFTPGNQGSPICCCWYYLSPTHLGFGVSSRVWSLFLGIIGYTHLTSWYCALATLRLAVLHLTNPSYNMVPRPGVLCQHEVRSVITYTDGVIGYVMQCPSLLPKLRRSPSPLASPSRCCPWTNRRAARGGSRWSQPMMSAF